MTKTILRALLFLAVPLLMFSNNAQAQKMGQHLHGKVSYYANKFNGRKTASGERFSNKKLTCAHRTFAFGTQLKVTNKATGQSVIVRVNDRGPYAKGRVVDLSRKAMEEIGGIKTGVIDATVEVVGLAGGAAESRPIVAPEATAAPKSAPNKPLNASVETIQEPALIHTFELNVQPATLSSGFVIQCGNYQSTDFLLQKLATIPPLGKQQVQVIKAGGQTQYRLLIGEFSSRKQAEKALTEVKKSFSTAFVIAIQKLKA